MPVIDREFVGLKLAYLERQKGVKRGGWRFWLFVFNCLASLALVCVFAGFVHWVFFVLAAIGVSGIVAFVDVVKIWNGIAK